MGSHVMIFLCLLCSFCMNRFSTEAAQVYLHHFCRKTSLFAPPDFADRSELHALISSLSSAAAHSIDGFANSTTGRNHPPDQASYGLFLCRGDLDTSTCGRCVAVGERGILERCPDHRASAIWYDQCMLRYSDGAIFSAVEPSPNRVLRNSRSVPDPTRFVRLLGETLNHVAARASAGGPRKKFAVAEANLMSSPSQKLYALAQCMPYLMASDCIECLQLGIANLAQGKEGGRFLAPSCNLRYELYPFYNASALSSPVPPALSPPPPAPSPPPPTPSPPPPAPVTRPEAPSNKSAVIIIVVAALSVGPVFLLHAWCFGGKNATVTNEAVQGSVIGLTGIPGSEPFKYPIDIILVATEKFSDGNKLGSGGFGDVFKGKLSDGQQIAVKKLSRSLEQGEEAFKNEVDSLAKVRHKNLVRLLGSCSEGEQRLLVYEFVQSGSLDQRLFIDPEGRGQLDWSTRYQIANGIAQGMRYLHDESQPRIIHRDLKASNVLLDGENKPKISDFGIARFFGADQSREFTSKIAGTRFYIAPEYAANGEFSMKSDVYSFGILLLELVSGKKSSSFYQQDKSEDIAIHAWQFWSDGTPLEMLDPAVIGEGTYSEEEVVRCLKIGVLCAKKDPNNRPTMEAIVQGLSSHPLRLELPPREALFYGGTEGPMAILGLGQSIGSSAPLASGG